MTAYLVSAVDPLVLRDGRPNAGRSESRTLPFPMPSTFAGVVRTALGRRGGEFEPKLVPTLLEHVRIRGPLLMHQDTLLVPAPKDALLLGDVQSIALEALSPVPLPPGCSASTTGLSLVGVQQGRLRSVKPLKSAPSFWSWRSMESWLRNPVGGDDERARDLLEGSVHALLNEERLHVAIGASFTAEQGKLFGTEGLRTVAATFEPGGRTRYVDLEFFVDVQVDAKELGELAEGWRALGGERRLSSWSRASSSLPGIPEWLSSHVEQGEESVVRVVLLTPAMVLSSRGPTALEREGIARIVAARVERPLTISGWDLKANGPKKTRRLAAAGSVFWVHLSGPPSERRRWLDDVWMRNVSDPERGHREHERPHPLARDGFGLAAVGIGGMR